MNTKNKLPKFPKKSEWRKKPAVFTKNSLIIANHEFMQRWETNYMKMLASIVAKKGGNILEIGFGLGISAHFIQKNQGIKTHTIIEFHPDIIKYCKKIYNKEIKNKRIKLFEGFWEDIVPRLPKESFNGILFDVYPLSENEIRNKRFHFLKEAYKLLKKDGVLTYFSNADTFKKFSKTDIKKIKKAGFKNIDYRICKVNPPKDCTYWNKKTIIAPIVIKNSRKIKHGGLSSV